MRTGVLLCSEHKQHTTFKELAEEWLKLHEVGEMKHSSLQRMKSCRERTYPEDEKQLSVTKD